MIIVIDDFFSKNDHVEILRQYESDMFPDHDSYFKRDTHAFIEKIISSSRKYVDYGNHVGYEMHYNGSVLNPHRDKDQDLFFKTKEQVFPLIGLVYYIKAKGTGGELVFPEDGASISPRERRLIIFERHMLHLVNEFQGERVSLGINPWDNIPLAYRSRYE